MPLESGSWSLAREEALEIAGVACWEWDPASGRVLASNNFARLLERDAGSLPGDLPAWLELVHHDQRAEFSRQLTAVGSGDLPAFALNLRLLHARGLWLWFAVNAKVLPDGPAGRRILVAFRDITEQKQIEAALGDSQLRYRALYSTSPLAFVVWDRQGHISEWNAKAEDLFGWPTREVIGKRVHRLLLPEDEHEAFRAAIRSLVRGAGDGSFSGRSLGKDGLLLHCDWHNVALRDIHGRLVGIMSLVVDATSERNARERLEKSEKRYRTLVETSPDAILQLATGGRLLAANQQAMRLFELDEFEIGQRIGICDLLPPEDRRDGLPDFLAHPEDFTGFIMNREQRMQRSSGGSFETELAYTTIVDSGGQPSGIVLFVRDITDKKDAQRQLERHQLHLQDLVAERTAELESARTKLTEIIKGSPVPIFVLDSEHVVTHWNLACERIIGIPAGSMLGTRDQWKAFYPSERPVMADLVMSTEAGTVSQLRKKYQPSQVVDGGYEGEAYFPAFDRWLFFTAAPLHDEAGKIVGAIETLQDVTQRKRAEQALIEAKSAAEAAAQAKAAFLANMSHEIRTPMNAVIGFTHLLLQTELSGRQRDYLSRIRGAGQLLLGLINDVLDFSKIEAGRMQLECAPFGLDEVLDNLATVLLSRAQEKGLELQYVIEPGVPATLVGDSLRLSQILINLVGNAIKFTARGSVTVFIRPGAVESGRIRLHIDVQDTGIGMSEEQQRNLFQAFSQGDTSITRRYGGTGLGLTICRRLVELMEGEMHVSSRAGVGSTFGFSAWLGIGEREEIRPSPVIRRVLVVDDNPLARMVLSRLLEKFGCRVVAASCGEEALAILGDAANESFDCVTIDFNMPNMDGVELARSIRALPAPIPRLALVTAADTNAFDAAGMLALFDVALNKPVTAAQIGKLLERLGQPTGAGMSAPAPAAVPLAGIRILVAEDLPTNRLIATEILHSLGASVETADNGVQVLQRLEERNGGVDVVLMDIQMPEMDGLAATRRLRADPRWHTLPVIAMTAHAFDEERRRCREAGMNDFITKPVDPDKVAATILRWRPASPAQPAAPAAAGAASAASAGGDGLPALPGIDQAVGMRHMMNKIRLYERVLRDFHQRFRDEAGRIGGALAAGDVEAAQRHAHSAKGLAGSIGALELQAAALALESGIRESAADLPARLAAFAAQLERVLGGIAAAYGLS